MDSILWSMLVLLITLAGWAPFRNTPLFQDQCLHLYIGRHWRRGKLPYRDYSMGPGPHLALIYALFSVLGGQSDRSIQFLSAMYVAVGNLFLFWSVKTSYGSAAALFAAIFFAFYFFNPRSQGDRMTPETYAVPPIMIAYACLLMAFGADSLFHAFSAGFFLGVAALFRQSAYVYALPLFFSLFYYASWQKVLMAVGGFLFIHLAWIIYFRSQNALNDYLRSTVWVAIRTAFFKSKKGAGQTESDPMKASRERMWTLLKTNSLTLLPLYLLALSGLSYTLFSDAGPHAATTALFFIAGVSLIFPRWNFDCCYWLNSVPWAAIFAGIIAGLLSERMTSQFLPEHMVVLALGAGCLFYVYLFDSPPYLTPDAEKRNALCDPQKLSHGSWWTTYDKIGAYLKEMTAAGDKILILGHAARILNAADREAFFYAPSFVLFKMKPFDVEDSRRFQDAIQRDYPEIIVLTGHLPAYPFNPQPYLRDLEDISEMTGIIYQEMKVIDGFPIYRADVEKSYVRSLLRNDFRNERLISEGDKLSEETRRFENNFCRDDAETALRRYLTALAQNGRYDDLIFTARTVLEQKIFSANPSFLHDLLLVMGEAQYQQGEAVAAEKTFQGVLGVFPGSAAAYNNLGAIRFAEGKCEEARVMFQKALALDPRNDDARANLAALGG